MPNDVIDCVHVLARRADNNMALTFADRFALPFNTTITLMRTTMRMTTATAINQMIRW
jgi:hypothetical protein